MKNILHLIIATLLTLCVACKKESKPVYTGIIAKKGGAEWKAEAVNTFTLYKHPGTKDTLLISGRNVGEYIAISLAQKGKGTYTGNQINAFFYQTVESGVVEVSYRLTNSQDNFVTITDYDEAGHILKGSFNFLMKREQNYDTFSDTLKLSNGKINIALADQSVRSVPAFQ